MTRRASRIQTAGILRALIDGAQLEGDRLTAEILARAHDEIGELVARQADVEARKRRTRRVRGIVRRVETAK